MSRFFSAIQFLFVAGCITTQTHVLESAAEVPAAHGEVSIDPDADGNNHIKLRVKHLAQPSAVVRGSEVYVVWIQSAYGDSKLQNIGILNIDDELSGELSTTVAYSNFNIFVTPEPSGDVTWPSGTKVLSTRKSMFVGY